MIRPAAENPALGGVGWTGGRKPCQGANSESTQGVDQVEGVLVNDLLRQGD